MPCHVMRCDLTGSSFDALPLRWRHVQATIRLLQVLHVLADVVRSGLHTIP